MKKNEEVKDKKTVSSGKKKFIISCFLIGIISAFIGGVGGYFLYQVIKPDALYAKDFNDLLSLEKRAQSSENLLEEFKEDQYNLINLAMLRYSKHRNTLALGSNTVDNFSGNQHVKTATINTNGRAFNQNISSTDPGAIVSINTAYRFYDENDGKIIAYENSFPTEWTSDTVPTKEYTYNEYINTYGKLHHGSYVVDKNGNYISDDLTSEGKQVSAVTIYQITKNSVKNCILTENESTYVFNLELYSSYACYYYSTLMKKNGGLSKNPRFDETLSMEFVLDKDFNLFSSSSTETYSVTLGIEVSCIGTSYTRYFASNDDLYVNDVKVEIPSIDEDFALSINEKGEFINE